jgi:hypothetical protein
VTDPYRIALLVVRLFAALNLVGAAGAFCALVVTVPLVMAVPPLVGLPLMLLTYGVMYLSTGVAMLLASRWIARFATGVERPESHF